MKITIDLNDLEIGVINSSKRWYELLGNPEKITAYSICCKILKAVNKSKASKKGRK